MKKILLLIAIVLILAGCSSKHTPDPNEKIESPEFKSYNGDQLRIGLIGEPPTIKEKNLIKFTSLELNQLDSSKYDAIFIMKEYLEQAAEDKYANVYRSTSIPFFFIQSKKSFIPFITKEISYRDADEFKDTNVCHRIFNNKIKKNINLGGMVFITIQSVKLT
ncbi:lipoprotein [Peribacillus psychrosaccharolyticus]|uniref:lipoprotein n=1 Tax=Peribacillus psychrosaccharolyticus TaxID=1407 RepID=UPI0006841AB9|nr:lipoprotein [Peribacillus psychrosaccharolyticus]